MARLKRVKRDKHSGHFSLPSSDPLPPDSVIGSIGGFCDHCDNFHPRLEFNFYCMACLYLAKTDRFVKVDNMYMGIVTCPNCGRLFYPVVEDFPKGFKFTPE